MSKTTQENKKKALKEQQKVEEQVQETTQKAQEEVIENTSPETSTEVTNETPIEESKTRQAKVRSKRYQAAKSKIDVSKYYPINEAVELAKATSLSKFDAKIEAHVTIVDIGTVGEIAFPHLESASKKIVVLNDTVLAEIKDGKVDFDILIATPVTMPKLLPFARVLGPKGLMPNPKSGTLTDDPEAAVKKLSAAKTVVRTEKKAPVVHIVVGKTSQATEELVANIQELINTVKANKIKKLAICATMGPSVKIEVLK